MFSRNVLKHDSTESSFLIVLISNSARFSWIPGSEPIHLDLEKLFLLSDSMENLKFNGKFEISEPEKKSKKIRKIPIRTLWGDELEMSSLYKSTYIYIYIDISL